MKRIHIFQAGTHTAMSGATIAFGEAVIAGIAAAYDPAVHEAPLVIGHPKHDAPAYGWVGELKADKAGLYAEPRQVSVELAEMVKAGKFKKISASFYPPDAANNPKPGSYYLRHVGFLGAQPPAVKGLRPIELGEADQAVTIELGDIEPPVDLGDGDRATAWSLRNLAALLRGVRDMLIEDKGAERADEILPSWRLDELNEQAGRIDSPGTSPAFADPTTPTTRETTSMSDKEIAAREAALAEKEAAFAEREKATAEALKASRREGNKSFVDGLVAAAQLPQGLAGLTLDLMEQLDGDQAVSFGEGDAKFEGTAQAAFRKLLATLPKSVDFGEHAKGEEPGASAAGFSGPSGAAVDKERLAVHNKALAFMEANPETDYLTAVRKVERAA